MAHVLRKEGLLLAGCAVAGRKALTLSLDASNSSTTPSLRSDHVEAKQRQNFQPAPSVTQLGATYAAFFIDMTRP